jgi:hypothetical protein
MKLVNTMMFFVFWSFVCVGFGYYWAMKAYGVGF